MAIYITPREAAVMTGLTLESIYRKISDGTLKAKKGGGRLPIERGQL
jgi:excisionase family DNA binding protein